MKSPDSTKQPLPNQVVAGFRPDVAQPELREPGIVDRPDTAEVYIPDDQEELQREIDRLTTDQVYLQSQSAAVGQEISDLKAQINSRRQVRREIWRERLVVRLEMKLGRALLAGYARYNSNDG